MIRVALVLCVWLAAAPVLSAQDRLPLIERVDLFTDADSAAVRELVARTVTGTPYVLDDPTAQMVVTVDAFRSTGFERVGTRVRVERRRKVASPPGGPSPMGLVTDISGLIEADSRYESVLAPQWTDPSTDREVCRSDPRTLLDPNYVLPSTSDSRAVDFQEERAPELIGGMEALQKQIVYPEVERRLGIQGRVWVQFVVDPTGVVECVSVTMSPTDGLAQASMDAVRNTRFTPGAQRGRTVRVRFSLPINFVLS